MTNGRIFTKSTGADTLQAGPKNGGRRTAGTFGRADFRQSSGRHGQGRGSEKGGRGYGKPCRNRNFSGCPSQTTDVLVYDYPHRVYQFSGNCDSDRDWKKRWNLGKQPHYPLYFSCGAGLWPDAGRIPPGLQFSGKICKISGRTGRTFPFPAGRVFPCICEWRQ